MTIFSAYSKMAFVAMAAAIILVTACSNKDNGDDASLDSHGSAANDNTLNVAVMPTLDCLPVFVACDRGFFDDRGGGIALTTFNAQMDCDEALKNGTVQAMVSDLLRTERIIRLGTPLTYITATDAYWQMLSNKDARVTKVDQLADKMLAMSRYSATDYLGTLAVDSAKPKFPVFRIQVNDVNIRLRMLLNKEVDAAMLTEPQATLARMARHKVLADSKHNDILLGVFAVRTDALANIDIQRHKDAFVDAYNQACDSINALGMTHYADILAARYGLDAEAVDALPDITFRHASPPRQKDIERTKNVKWKTF